MASSIFHFDFHTLCIHEVDVYETSKLDCVFENEGFPLFSVVGKQVIFHSFNVNPSKIISFLSPLEWTGRRVKGNPWSSAGDGQASTGEVWKEEADLEPRPRLALQKTIYLSLRCLLPEVSVLYCRDILRQWDVISLFQYILFYVFLRLW